MHTAGAAAAAIPFCRRASRSRAEGTKTEGESQCLLSRSGGRSMIERLREKACTGKVAQGRCLGPAAATEA